MMAILSHLFAVVLFCKNSIDKTDRPGKMSRTGYTHCPRFKESMKISDLENYFISLLRRYVCPAVKREKDQRSRSTNEKNAVVSIVIKRNKLFKVSIDAKEIERSISFAFYLQHEK
jgi:hypothetical protein